MKDRIPATVSQWQGVKAGKYLGQTAFFVSKTPFLIVREDSIALANLSPRDEETAVRKHGGGELVLKGKRREGWIEMSVSSVNEYRRIEFLVQISYQSAHLSG